MLHVTIGCCYGRQIGSSFIMGFTSWLCAQVYGPFFFHSSHANIFLQYRQEGKV